MNTFGQIFAYCLSVVFISLTIFLARKKRFRWAGGFGVFSFVSFLLAQFHGNNSAISLGSLNAEQVLCWCFGLMFLGVAIYFVHEKALAYAFALSVISVFCCFCGFSSVQGLLKTHMLWLVTDTLKSYGDKIDNFQTTMAEMQKRLATKQAELETNQMVFVAELKSVQTKIQDAETNIFFQQSDITNQFQKISVVQSGLEMAQTNLATQQAKISDVEYWVQNLYDKVQEESYSTTDTNHICFVNMTNGGTFIIIRLEHTPISGSVQAYAKDNHGIAENRLAKTQFLGNLVCYSLFQYDMNNTQIAFRYVEDNRGINFYSRMPKLGVDMWVKQEGLGQFEVRPPTQLRP